MAKPLKERDVEAHFVDCVETILKGETRKYKSRRNDPDRIVFLPGGKLYFVELKRPGKDAREGQAREHKRLRDLGFDVAVLNTIEAVDEWVTDKQGKNRCPECGYGLLRMGTLNKRVCTNCNLEFYWELAKGQKRDYC